MTAEPKVVEWQKTLEQDGDCGSNEPQNLVISMTDGGGGAYFVIETTRWAFNDLDDLIEVLQSAGVARRKPQDDTGRAAA